MASSDDRVLRAGPALRDYSAAAACPCGCHPRVGDHHGGGAACPCQQTPEERKAATARKLAAYAELKDARPLGSNPPAPADSAAASEAQMEYDSTPELRDILARAVNSATVNEGQRRFDAAAGRLGVTNAVIECHACPTVVSGIVDGRFFYLRERHGTWRVTLAPEDDPLLNVWDHNTVQQGVDIASGSEDDLYSATEPFSFAYVLEFAVRVVRDHLRRSSCSHAVAQACVSAHFCPTCGTRLEAAS